MSDEPKALDITTYRATGFQMAATSTELLLMVTAMTPAMVADGSSGAVVSPMCAVSLSPQAAKELQAVLSDAVAAYEADHGELRTAWLDARNK